MTTSEKIIAWINVEQKYADERRRIKHDHEVNMLLIQARHDKTMAELREGYKRMLAIIDSHRV